MSKEYLSDFSLKAIFSEPEKFRPYIKIKNYKAGELIGFDLIHEYNIYIFLEGKFNVYGLHSDGGQFLFRSCEAVMMIGENELFVHAHKDLMKLYRTAFSIEILSASTAIVLNFRTIIDELLKDVNFLNMMNRSLVEKMLYFGGVEMDAVMSSAEVRVAQYLISAADKEAKIKGNQAIVAEQLRMSYRHLHRILKKFVDEGCIERIRGGYRIRDEEKLNKYI